LHRREEWREIPIVVVTAKDVTQTDRERLDGYVKQVIQKGEHTRDDLLVEVRDLIRDRCVKPGTIAKPNHGP
jgi:hypothetical protein